VLFVYTTGTVQTLNPLSLFFKGIPKTMRFLILSVLSLLCGVATSFAPKAPWTVSKSTGTELNMVFDFFKKRSEEGLDQLSKLSDAASKGNLDQALMDAATYTKVTNEAFADGLAKSRNRLLTGLESILTGSDDALEDFQDLLLQADLGMATAEDIVNEVKSLREDSTKFLSRDDLKSVMRGKLIEILQRNKSTVRFAEPEDKIPTVLFIMGANGMGK
jgi:signal recognition particle GTPase